jgi:hypothetical protein
MECIGEEKWSVWDGSGDVQVTKSNFNSLANQLDKNKNLAKLTSPRAYMRARIVIVIVVSL